MKYVLNTVVVICMVSLIGCKPRVETAESELSTASSNGLSIFAGSYVQINENGEPLDEGSVGIKVIGKKLSFYTYGYEGSGVIFEEVVDGKENVEKYSVSSTSMGGLTRQITKRIVTVVARSGNTVSKIVKMYSRPFGYVLSEYSLYKTTVSNLKLDGDRLTFEQKTKDTMGNETKKYTFLKNEA